MGSVLQPKRPCETQTQEVHNRNETPTREIVVKQQETKKPDLAVSGGVVADTLTLLSGVHGWLFALLRSVSVGAAVVTGQVPRRTLLASVSHDAMRLVEGEALLLVVRRGAVAVHGRWHHHRVGEGRGSARSGGAGRGDEGAEVEQRTQGEEGRASRERLQVASRCVSRQRPVGTAVTAATAGAANAHRGGVA